MGQQGYAPATLSRAPVVHPYERQRVEPFVVGLGCQTGAWLHGIICRQRAENVGPRLVGIGRQKRWRQKKSWAKIKQLEAI